MIKLFKSKISGFDSAIDCGAGYGRITKDLLVPKFKKVDLLDPSKEQVSKAKEHVPEVRNFFLTSLQDFDFKAKYDCIWVQWCLCYLTDKDCMAFLEKAREGLKNTPSLRKQGKSGLMFVKENVTRGKQEYDKADKAIIHEKEWYSAMFKKAGFTILKQFYQTGFPRKLHKVRCFVLQKKF